MDLKSLMLYSSSGEHS